MTIRWGTRILSPTSETAKPDAARWLAHTSGGVNWEPAESLAAAWPFFVLARAISMLVTPHLLSRWGRTSLPNEPVPKCSSTKHPHANNNPDCHPVQGIQYS